MFFVIAVLCWCHEVLGCSSTSICWPDRGSEGQRVNTGALEGPFDWQAKISLVPLAVGGKGNMGFSCMHTTRLSKTPHVKCKVAIIIYPGNAQKTCSLQLHAHLLAATLHPWELGITVTVTTKSVSPTQSLARC